MKRLSLAFLVCSIHFLQFIVAAPGCMDNSYHADECGPLYDYKNYHPVECNCQCDRYAHLLDRGMCRHCRHYRVPNDLNFTIKKGGRSNRAARSVHGRCDTYKLTKHESKRALFPSVATILNGE